VLFDVFTWELPSGGVEVGHAPLEMAQIELQQEMRVGAKKMVEIGRVQTANARLTELQYVFIGSELTDEAQDADANEEFERVWLDLKEVRRMVLAGEIVDGITLYALYLYELQLKTNV
jgi:8-oxo-dGTP pyrophosphatase MutT (NUDIX family)